MNKAEHRVVCPKMRLSILLFWALASNALLWDCKTKSCTYRPIVMFVNQQLQMSYNKDSLFVSLNITPYGTKLNVTAVKRLAGKEAAATCCANKVGTGHQRIVIRCGCFYRERIQTYPPTSSQTHNTSSHHQLVRRLLLAEAPQRAGDCAPCGTTRTTTRTGRALSVATQQAPLPQIQIPQVLVSSLPGLVGRASR